MRPLLTLLAALTLACGSSSDPPAPTGHPSSEFEIIPDILGEFTVEQHNALTRNLFLAERSVRGFLADHRIARVPYASVRVQVTDDWACHPWASRRTPSGVVTMRLCDQGSAGDCRGPGTQRSPGWVCGLSFELAMMLLECNGGAGGYCADEHADGWDGYTQPAAHALDMELTLLEWDGEPLVLEAR